MKSVSQSGLRSTHLSLYRAPFVNVGLLWIYFSAGLADATGLASPSLLCMCHLHMTEATDAYLSVLFFPRKLTMEMSAENNPE